MQLYIELRTRVKLPKSTARMLRPEISGDILPKHHRLPGESAKAFFAFQQWLDLGATRSLPKVSQQLSKSLAMMKRWSATHRWSERLYSFEAEQAKTRLDAEIASARARADHDEARRMEMEEDAYALYIRIKTRLLQMLNFPLTKQIMNASNETTVIIPTNWRLADVACLGHYLNELSQIACGKTAIRGGSTACNSRCDVPIKQGSHAIEPQRAIITFQYAAKELEKMSASDDTLLAKKS